MKMRSALPLFNAFAAMGCTENTTERGPSPVCSENWYRAVEAELGSGDGLGHGPDLGSDEWQSVIEFKLGVRDQPELPARGTDAWCGFVAKAIKQR